MLRCSKMSEQSNAAIRLDARARCFEISDNYRGLRAVKSCYCTLYEEQPMG